VISVRYLNSTPLALASTNDFFIDSIAVASEGRELSMQVSILSCELAKNSNSSLITLSTPCTTSLRSVGIPLELASFDNG
jgi:hypothetical protein